MSKPRRRVQIKLDLGADSWENVPAALAAIQYQVAIGQMRGHAVSGGPSYGYIWEASEDESVTHESYFAEIDALARPSEGGEGRA